MTHPIPASTAAKLPLMEAFYTIQGEGAFTGHAAYFIRLGGCDVGCVWCDVKESWDFDAHPYVAADAIADEAARHPARIAVITGGEPALHDLTELTAQLKARNFQVHIETSGSSPLHGHFDWITLSPKKFKFPIAEAYSAAHELKIIVFNKSDLKWAEQEATKVRPHCKLLLQPEWGKREQMMPLITQYVMANPQWHISLQVHKYLDIP
ncbi:MAG: 7-carboxy-7-deazaguanine synthase QueE [Bacteroidia bacterium]